MFLELSMRQANHVPIVTIFVVWYASTFPKHQSLHPWGVPTSKGLLSVSKQFSILLFGVFNNGTPSLPGNCIEDPGIEASQATGVICGTPTQITWLSDTRQFEYILLSVWIDQLDVGQSVVQ